jgi:hypothetical protein
VGTQPAQIDPMRNERLTTAMTDRTLSRRAVAEQLLVDAKTVERWLHGRVPQPRHRLVLAGLLAQPESYLWPELRSSHAGTAAPDAAGLVSVFARRCDVPQPLWNSLIQQATDRIDVLAYAALFLPEEHPDLVSTLAAKSAEVEVRIALGDPRSDKVAERGAEEELFDGMAARIRMTLKHLQPLASSPNVAVHLHATTLYNSIFRFGDEMLVNTHVYAGPAYRSPVLHLRQTFGCNLFETYTASFDAVWRTSVPLDPDLWGKP